MSDLSAALQAAVSSVEEDRRRRAAGGVPRARPVASGVILLDDHALPPVLNRSRQRETFIEAVGREFGPVAAAALTGLKEAGIILGLFWVAAIMLAFVEVEGSVHIPGIGDATVISLALVVAVVLRAVLAAVSRASQVDGQR